MNDELFDGITRLEILLNQKIKFLTISLCVCVFICETVISTIHKQTG